MSTFSWDEERIEARKYFRDHFDYAKPRLLRILKRESKAKPIVIRILKTIGITLAPRENGLEKQVVVDIFDSLGTAGSPAIGEVSDLLSTHSSAYYASRILANMGNPGIDRLCQAVWSVDATARDQIAAAFGECTRPTAKMLQCLDKLLFDLDKDVASEAAVALAKHSEPTVRQFNRITEIALGDIEEAAVENSAWSQSYAIWALRIRAVDVLSEFGRIPATRNEQKRKAVECLRRDLEEAREQRSDLVSQGRSIFYFDPFIGSIVKCMNN